jgi:hypothetical protein
MMLNVSAERMIAVMTVYLLFLFLSASATYGWSTMKGTNEFFIFQIPIKYRKHSSVPVSLRRTITTCNEEMMNDL